MTLGSLHVRNATQDLNIVFSQQWHQFVSAFTIVLLGPSEVTGHSTTQSSPINHVLKIKFNCHQVTGILDYSICWPPCRFNPLHRSPVAHASQVSCNVRSRGLDNSKSFGNNYNKYTMKQWKGTFNQHPLMRVFSSLVSCFDMSFTKTLLWFAKDVLDVFTPSFWTPAGIKHWGSQYSI